jgi:hypothetical protein
MEGFGQPSMKECPRKPSDLLDQFLGNLTAEQQVLLELGTQLFRCEVAAYLHEWMALMSKTII